MTFFCLCPQERDKNDLECAHEQRDKLLITLTVLSVGDGVFLLNGLESETAERLRSEEVLKSDY